MNPADDVEPGALVLKLANRIFPDKQFQLKEEFKDCLQTYFAAKPKGLDFRDDPENAAKKINGWVEKKTNGKIRDLVNADDFSEHTLMVLVNAIYLKVIYVRMYDTTRANCTCIICCYPYVTYIFSGKLVKSLFTILHC